jgi:DNA mismatch endonuclease Vsr
MTDVHDSATRSRNMAAIKGKNTRPERWLRQRLHALGFRYRLNVSTLPGKPDLVFPCYKAVIFVHGCFWHMHQCPLFHLPATRTDWWEQKLILNRQRDLAEQDKLRELGWRVLLVWECAIKGHRKIPEAELMVMISEWLKHGSCYAELPIPDNEQTTT